MISPVINGFVINAADWRAVFGLIAVLFVVFVVILLVLNIGELTDNEINDRKTEKEAAKAN